MRCTTVPRSRPVPSGSDSAYPDQRRTGRVGHKRYVVLRRLLKRRCRDRSSRTDPAERDRGPSPHHARIICQRLHQCGHGIYDFGAVGATT